jgi:hypothetical protein
VFKKYIASAVFVIIKPFALSLSKGEWENSKPEVKPFMLRQAQHERLNLIAVCCRAGSFFAPPKKLETGVNIDFFTPLITL